jgi:hypothetical protein
LAPVQGWQQQPRKNGDDDDDNQEFDQSKPFAVSRDRSNDSSSGGLQLTQTAAMKFSFRHKREFGFLELLLEPRLFMGVQSTGTHT